LTALSSTTKTLGPKLQLNEFTDFNSFKGYEGLIFSDSDAVGVAQGEVEGVSKKVDFGIGKNFGSLFSDGK
jgi:hypothetical protein